MEFLVFLGIIGIVVISAVIMHIADTYFDYLKSLNEGEKNNGN